MYLVMDGFMFLNKFFARGCLANKVVAVVAAVAVVVAESAAVFVLPVGGGTDITAKKQAYSM